MTPADRILQKILVTSSIPSKDWEKIRVGLRDRAFFSSRIESAKFLADSRKTIADLLSGAQTERGTIATRDDAIKAIRENATRLSLPKTGKSTLTDPTSRSRAAVIVDTNAGLASGYVRHEQNMTLGARLAFPAQEFVRVRPSQHPRTDWSERWVRSGGKIYGGRMVALVESSVWSSLSRFGVPYPPFDYGSGMGKRMVSRDDAIALGVIQEDFKPKEAPVQPGFNDTLKTDVDIGHLKSGEFDQLRSTFGDQVKFNQDSNGMMSARWSGIDVRNIFNDPSTSGNGKVRSMGKASSDLMTKLPSDLTNRFKDKNLSITKELVSHMKNDGHWPIEKSQSINLQIREEELDVIPCIWRNPDRVVNGKDSMPGTAVLELESMDGGTYCLVVDGYSNKCEIKTFYKRK